MCDIGPCDASSSVIYRPITLTPEITDEVLFCEAVSRDRCVTPRASTPFPTPSAGACEAVTRPIINELQPILDGTNPRRAEVELRGVPGEQFSGFLLSIGSDLRPSSRRSMRIGGVTQVTGTFDSNGLLSVSIDDVDLPSRSIVLTQGFAGSLNYILDQNNDGVIDDVAYLGIILDAIGVPASLLGEDGLVAQQLGGTDLKYIGADPTLSYRDGCSLKWYDVKSESGTSTLFDASGDEMGNPPNFDKDPRETTFNGPNPMRFPR